MADKPDSSRITYRIGAVARWSGVPIDTLRIWERRYQAVTPTRSLGGDRLYNAEDLARLTLIKHLIDSGDSISHLAGLSREELEERIRASNPTMSTPDGGPVTVIAVGAELENLVKSAQAELPGLRLQAAYRSLSELESQPGVIAARLLALEVPTLHEETVTRMIELAHRAQAEHTLVIYRYTSKMALRRIPVTNFSTMRGPIDINDFKRRYQEIIGQTDIGNAGSDRPGALTAAPRRRYDDTQLARLAQLKSPIQCECPRHLAELITTLAAFERYSMECESRNDQDAALHAQLHTATAHARHLIEQALEQVITAENIEV